MKAESSSAIHGSPGAAAASDRVIGQARAVGMLAAFTVAILLGGCPREQMQAPPPMTPEVATITVETQRVALTSELPGRTSAWLVAEVRPQVSGLIQERLFEEGADVEAGQVLYQIDDAPYLAALNQTKANLVAAQNAAKQVRAALEASIAAVAQQKAVLELAEINRQRFETLAVEGAESASQRDRYVTEAEVAAATLRSVQAKLESDRQAIEVADAAISQAEAAVASAQVNLDYTKIIAPIAGRIGKSNVTVGSLATAHQPMTLTTIQQLDPIYVDVPQSYGELLALRRRLENNHLENDEIIVRQVRLILEDGTPYAHEGTLQFRDVTVNSSTNSVLIRMVFPNPEGILVPGMFVRAVITEGVNPAAILVPQQAVSRDPKAQPIAMLVDDAGMVEQRVLTIDRAVGNQWLIAEGLAPGDRIIMEGVQRVRHGIQVNAVPFGTPEGGGAPPTGGPPQPGGEDQAGADGQPANAE